ncbi:hypothetical protein F7U66_00345 [Vibrio parahaemolyticus]|nr:hypothetical protein [Vibrio parahaemolyticus]
MDISVRINDIRSAENPKEKEQLAKDLAIDLHHQGYALNKMAELIPDIEVAKLKAWTASIN